MNLKKQKICLFIPSLGTGGMERVMSELANFFVKREDLEVHLVLFGISPVIFYNLSPNIKIHRADFVFENKYRLWFSIKTMFFLRKKAQEIKPVSILSFGEYWNSFVLLSLIGLNIPTYISDRCQPNKSLGKLHDTLRKLLYPFSSGVILQTKIAKEIYQKIIPVTQFHVIGNPIRSIYEEKSVKREKNILNVGRLINSKHHDRLIRIFTQLNAPDWKLVIVGGDAIKQKNFSKLQSIIKEENLTERIIFTGTQLNVDDYYRSSSIFAFTSSSEGFPNVIGEALSAGLPVVSYNCIAGPAEMISEGENGYLVDVFDDEMFRNRLQYLIDNEEIRNNMTQVAISKIQEFSIESIGNEFLEIILEK
jgi:glycosyltransferase involved in cell wall biosynthesis